jgi:hypothetical protein
MLIRNREMTGDSSDFLSITVWKSWVIETTISKGTATQRGVCMANKYCISSASTMGRDQ